MSGYAQSEVLLLPSGDEFEYLAEFLIDFRKSWLLDCRMGEDAYSNRLREEVTVKADCFPVEPFKASPLGRLAVPF